jgi:hypothetical protein
VVDRVVVDGDVGIGKTALAEAASRAAIADGWTVVWVQGVESDDPLAYAGLLNMLGGSITDEGSEAGPLAHDHWRPTGLVAYGECANPPRMLSVPPIEVQAMDRRESERMVLWTIRQGCRVGSR